MRSILKTEYLSSEIVYSWCGNVIIECLIVCYTVKSCFFLFNLWEHRLSGLQDRRPKWTSLFTSLCYPPFAPPNTVFIVIYVAWE
jgi:hypothetical protein